MSPTPTISIAVCTMSVRRDDLVGCLESLTRARGIEAEEVLLVTRDGDPLPDLLETFGPRLPVRGVPSELESLSSKRNAAFRAARGVIVAYLDDDATVEQGYVLAIREAFRTGVCAVAGALIPVFDEEPDEELRPIAFRIGGFNTWRDEVRPEAWAGANCAFRRDRLIEAGPFDLRLGPGGSYLPWGDDSEMFRRFENLGGVRFAPEIRVHHRIQRERVRRGYVFLRAYRNGRTQCVIDRMHQRAFVRRALLVPPMALLALIRAWRPGADLASRLQARRLGGYVHQLVLLGLGKGPS